MWCCCRCRWPFQKKDVSPKPIPRGCTTPGTTEEHSKPITLRVTPPVFMTGGTTYHHFGLDTETQRLYVALIEESDEKRIHNGTITLSNRFMCFGVQGIETDTDGTIICHAESLFDRTNTLSVELKRLSDGDMYVTRYFTKDNTRINLNTTRYTVPPTPTQTFQPEGHPDFDKLAVLFVVPT